jgi:ligand-binding sensor domain-containing protein
VPRPIVIRFALLFCLLAELGDAQLPVASFNYLKRDRELYSSKYSSLVEDNHGYIWFGSLNGGGLYRYDGYNLRSFIPDPAQLKQTLGSSIIRSIYQVNDTLIYVGTFFGYSMLNPITGKMTSFNNVYEDLDKPSEGEGISLAFLQDSVYHQMWVATGYGIAAIDHATGRFALKYPKSEDGETKPIMVTHLLQDPVHQDVLLFAGPSGLYRYYKTNNRFETIPCPVLNDSTFYVTALCTDKDKIWIGTHSDQLLHYAPADQTWTKYTIPRAKRTPDATIALTKIIPIDDTRIWIAAFSHVGLFNPKTGHWDAWEYNEDNPSGLLPIQHYHDLLPDRHGRLWIGSWFGIQYANQSFMPPSTVVKNIKVGITGLDIKPIISETEKPLLYVGELTLEQSQRDLTFQYVLPNPLDKSAVTYQYTLDGYDKEWITTDQRTVRYGQLPGGDYTFRIKAREGQQAPWTPETTLVIHIPKKITELLWFWVVIGLLTIGTAIVLFRMMVSRARRQEKMKADFEHQLSEIQMQALRAQMNPHFLFNSLNSIKYYAISKSKDETATYLSKFALLVRNILTNSKSRTISLKEEVDALRLYIEIEHMRLEGKFEYTIDIDSSIPIRQVQIPPMILQPFVENAIWHGLMHKEGKGMLRVHIQDMGRQIQCVIEDNGIGRVRSAELRKSQMEHRKSEGMQITADRIALINRIYQINTEVDVIDLQHPDGTAAGTRVVIHVPLINDEEE